MQNTTFDTAGHWLRAAFGAGLPVVLGYVVLGLPCGILGVQAGLSVAQVACMSVLFYSGAGQYMIANLWMAGAAPLSIIASVSLVNTRQLLYSASLARFCRTARKRAALFFAATVTDESFGVNLKRFEASTAEPEAKAEAGAEASTKPTEHWQLKQAIVANVLPWLSWIFSNTLGAAVGSVLTVPVALASFAMTSIFLCLLFTQKLTAHTVVAALVAAAGVLGMKLLGLPGPAIFMGAVLGIVAALLLPKQTPAPQKPSEHKGGAPAWPTAQPQEDNTAPWHQGSNKGGTP